MIGGTSIYNLNIVKLIVFVTLLLRYIGKHQGSPSVTRKLHLCYEQQQKIIIIIIFHQKIFLKKS